MMIESQMLLAFALDMAVGDPRWLPHPVRGIGLLAAGLEKLTRRLIAWQRLAGIVTAILVIGLAGAAGWAIVRFLGQWHPLAGDIAAVLIIYWAIAPRDLADHALPVYRALRAGDIECARAKVAMLVGRDVKNLDEKEVSRATVESVAESTIDGVTAPLFWAAVAGPAGAIAYRAANTLDSMFGHKDEKYIRFGWASARLDDLANLIPARLTGPFVALAALLTGRRPWNCLKILARDRRKHESPNSGYGEAAFAGALGVRLGGRNYYDGLPADRPFIGETIVELAPTHIVKAVAIMFLTAGLFLAACIAGRMAVCWACQSMGYF